MQEPRYAIFEPLAPSPRHRTRGSRSSDLAASDPDYRLRDFGAEEDGATSLPDAPAKVSFVDASDAERARREGRHPLRVPRMPIRVIPHVAASAAREGGTPWGIAAVGVDRSSFTGAGVCVAVLDTGIDARHPAFAGLITDSNYQDFTGTGLADTVGHGTHCAGIIFGRDVGGIRIGVARSVTKVLVAKIADRATTTTTETLERALLWAVEQGADIVSMSVGLDFLGHAKRLQAEGIPQDAAIAQALSDYRDYARFFDALMGRVVSAGAAGRSALVVAAAGNDSRADGTPPYRVGATLPAVAEGVLSVGAVGQDEGGRLVLASFSNSGANICAPGVAILSSMPGGGTGTMSGTSQAAPHVAGIAALWWQKVRAETFFPPNPRDIISRIRGTANFAAVLSPEEPEAVGQGLVIAP